VCGCVRGAGGRRSGKERCRYEEGQPCSMN
jgi:hypothetical protein